MLAGKAQRNTADTGAEPDRVQRLAETKAAETMTDKTAGHTNMEGETAHKGLSRPGERQTETNTGRGQNVKMQRGDTERMACAALGGKERNCCKLNSS